MSEVCNMFWHGNFGNIQQAIVDSYARNGFKVYLWSYSNIKADNAISMDARKVAPESDLYKYSFPSISGNKPDYIVAFSEFFRYAVLLENPGWWFDLDCVCLKNQSEFKDIRSKFGNNQFLCAKESESVVASAFIYADKDTAFTLFQYFLNRAKKYNNSFPEWGFNGPVMMTDFIKDNEQFKDNVLPIIFAFSISYKEPLIFSRKENFNKGLRKIKNSYLSHVWFSSVGNEVNTYEKGSLLDYMLKS